MTIEILYSYWSADDSSFVQRVPCALEATETIFPVTTYWKALPAGRGMEDHLKASNKEKCQALGGRHSEAWKATVAHCRTRDADPDRVLVNSAAYSPSIALGVRVFFNAMEFSCDNEGHDKKMLLTKHLDKILTVLRAIGSCSTISGCWLRKHSFFAGKPECIYEPNPLFSKLYDSLEFDHATDDIRAVRTAVRAILDVDKAVDLLKELGLEPEKIGKDRLFVRLGDPLKAGGCEILKEVNKRIGSLLRSS